MRIIFEIQGYPLKTCVNFPPDVRLFWKFSIEVSQTNDLLDLCLIYGYFQLTRWNFRHQQLLWVTVKHCVWWDWSQETEDIQGRHLVFVNAFRMVVFSPLFLQGTIPVSRQEAKRKSKKRKRGILLLRVPQILPM